MFVMHRYGDCGTESGTPGYSCDADSDNEDAYLTADDIKELLSL